MPTFLSDPQSIFLIVLGPVSIAALIGLAVWWLKTRGPGNGKPPGAP